MSNRKTYGDEMTLEWVRLRCAGETATEIAARYNTTSQAVSVATNRVRRDDLLHSGERARDVLAGYWT